MGKVNLKVPLYKTVTYRICGSVTSAAITYFITGDIKVSSAIGVGDLLLKPIIYFVHELIWQRFS